MKACSRRLRGPVPTSMAGLYFDRLQWAACHHCSHTAAVWSPPVTSGLSRTLSLIILMRTAMGFPVFYAGPGTGPSPTTTGVDALELPGTSVPSSNQSIIFIKSRTPVWHPARFTPHYYQHTAFFYSYAVSCRKDTNKSVPVFLYLVPFHV